MKNVCPYENAKCAYIPIHEEVVTDATSEMIEVIGTWLELEITETAKLLAETKDRRVIGMACTTCGKINRVDD